MTDHSGLPLHLYDVIPESLFLTIHLEMKSDWTLNNRSNHGQTLSWGKTEKNILPFMEAACIVKLKIQKTLKESLTLCKIHCNGQTQGQGSSFHTDYSEDGYWTFVLFTEPTWNTTWGGEFVCFNPIKEEYQYTPYLPNTGVLIPSNWEHDGRSPAQTDRLRTSLAFSYVKSNYADTHFETTPNNLAYR